MTFSLKYVSRHFQKSRIHFPVMIADTFSYQTEVIFADIFIFVYVTPGQSSEKRSGSERTV